MKKLIAVTILLAVMAGLTACGKTETGTTDPPPAVSETTPPADDAGQTADDATPPETAQDQPASPSGS